MNRRKFIKRTLSSAALASTSALTRASWARNHKTQAEQGSSTHLFGGDAVFKPNSWGGQFRTALADKPWLLGYRSAVAPEFQSQATVTGAWPADLTGTLYRNGPAQHEIGDFRYQHWFDGDGMVQAFRINTDLKAKGVSHQAKLVQTHKLTAEQAAGRALYPGFGTLPPNPNPITSPDVLNPGNISMLAHHGKLLALWEAGSPWEINPDNLDTVGQYEFSSESSGVPFSAHPRVEADGTLWNFGYVNSANLLVLWHVTASGKVAKVATIKCDPISMPHDFIVTAKHIVLLIPPLHYDAALDAESFLDTHRWQPQSATRVLVVNKNDFDDHQWLELPAQWVFHFGNGWEDDQGVIHFDAARAPNPMAMIESFREIMRGASGPEISSHHHSYRIDTHKRTATETPMFNAGLDSEFPAIDPRVSCQRNQQLVMLTAENSRTDQTFPAHGQLNSVSKYNYQTDKLHTYRYPDQQIPEEHLFVPKPGSAPETAGWIVGTALDFAEQQTLLNVFDAQQVADGPVATATLPYALPLGLHGKFV